MIVAYLISSLLMRACSPEVFAYRAWESVHLFSSQIGPFRPSYVFDKNRSYGDLAYLGNLPAHRQYRREIFSTDAYGFRYPGCDLEGGRYDIVILGDSFAVGSGVSDNEALAAQVRAISGLRVCNGAGLGPDRRRTMALLERLNLQGTVVAWQVSERFQLPRQTEALPSLLKSSSHIPLRSPWLDKARVLALVARDVGRYSPLSLALHDALRRLENDELLPNSSRREVLNEQLADGSQMLFYSDEVVKYCTDRKIELDGLISVRDHVRRNGGELVVMPVPDKYAVYRSLLATPTIGCAPVVPFVELEERLFANAGIRVCAVASRLVTLAAAGLPSGEFVYWCDDTHWNPRGIREAAVALLESRDNYLWETQHRYH